MIHLSTTPSDFSIEFEDGEPDPTTGRSKQRRYTVNEEKLVSVTTALGILDKPGLKFAAEKLTIAAAVELAQQGELPNSVDGALSRMKSRDMRFFQQWSKKSERGTVTHEDLVNLTLGAEPMDLSEFTPDQRGFIRGVSGWYADARPQILESEVMVASVEHGFAGRHDLYGLLPLLHPTARFLIDLKTTDSLPRDKGGGVKTPYDENLLQLAGYEIARRESGYDPSDYQAVLRVDSAGAYDLFVIRSDPQWFLSILGAYKALKALPRDPVESFDQLEVAA